MWITLSARTCERTFRRDQACVSWQADLLDTSQVVPSRVHTTMQPFVPQQLPTDDLRWEPLIPLIGRANRSLAQYEGVLYAVPNPEVLLSPLTTQEAP